MATHVRHLPFRDPAQTLGRADLPIARLVLLLLLAVPLTAAWMIVSTLNDTSNGNASEIAAALDPLQYIGDNQNNFLPPPVAVLPPVQAAAPADSDPAAAEPTDAPPSETVKVVNAGGIGAVLRASPPRGQRVTGLRDGQSLIVLERQTVDGQEWVHVQTPTGTQGWIFGRLVAT